MSPVGYHPVQHTPGLWFHDKRKPIFSHVVDDFCVQYSPLEDTGYFFNSLRAKYLITINMKKKVYIGINLDWDHVKRTVIFTMPNYVRKALQIFQHIFVGGKE